MTWLFDYFTKNNLISMKFKFENIDTIHYYNNCVSTQMKRVLTKKLIIILNKLKVF